MNKKPTNSAGLHVFIATGGKPAAYSGTKGINSQTVPNIKKSDNTKKK